MQFASMWQNQKTSPKAAAAAVRIPSLPHGHPHAEPLYSGLPLFTTAPPQHQQYLYSMQQFTPPTIYVTYHGGPGSGIATGRRGAEGGADPLPATATSSRFNSRYSPYAPAATSPSPPRSCSAAKYEQNALAKQNSSRHYLAPVEFAQPLPVTFGRTAENRLPPPPAPPLSTWKGNAPAATEAWSEWWARFKSDQEKDAALPKPYVGRPTVTDLPFSASSTRQAEAAAASLPSPASSHFSSPPLCKKEMEGSAEEDKGLAKELPRRDERIRAVLAGAESQCAENPAVSDLIRQIRDILDA